jgi:hypothetical protein
LQQLHLLAVAVAAAAIQMFPAQVAALAVVVARKLSE